MKIVMLFKRKAYIRGSQSVQRGSLTFLTLTLKVITYFKYLLYLIKYIFSDLAINSC